MSYTPIVLFVYNRPWHTHKTVEALKHNVQASNSMLFVFSDYPSTQENASLVTQVRDYLKTINGFASVTIVERDRNYGLAANIIAGVTEIVNRFGRVIVMEDDLLTSPFFLTYMNTALDMYEGQEKVISIHGYTYPTNIKLPETFFIRGADCWGWGTWKRAWRLFEPDGKKLLEELEESQQTKEFDFNGTYSYKQMLKNQIAGKINSWAIRWYASAFLKNKLTLYPGRSLVHNIGNDGSGTHCAAVSYCDVVLSKIAICVKEIPMSEDGEAHKAFEKFFRDIEGSFIDRLKRRIKRICIYLNAHMLRKNYLAG